VPIATGNHRCDSHGRGSIGSVNESIYAGNSDNGSNFRIDSCQCVYNLNSRALGAGTYRIDILSAVRS
jgi:hypothetical protein